MSCNAEDSYAKPEHAEIFELSILCLDEFLVKCTTGLLVHDYPGILCRLQYVSNTFNCHVKLCF